VIEAINPDLYAKLKAEEAIHSGMIPKLDNCFNCLSKGVKQIKIGHHRMLQNKTATYTTITL
jgi:acetylglutamate kinase